MKKVKRMMFGGVSKAAGKSLQQVSKMPGGVNQNAPADVQKMMANLPRGSTVAGPGTGLGSAAQANPKIRASVQNAISNLKAGNIPKAQPGSMVGQRFGGLGMKKGGKVSSASRRADGCAIRGKTRA